ncbi:MAG: phospho-N-acetylmuramoyl-pentapeptide-transferase [Actinobacteria bacterium]|nr:phospho-N-acetylmuramoyl-pentapeptide-transferase [Actinomycetota bacterium]
MLSILTAGAIAMTVTLFGTRFLIAFLSRRGFGQFIRDDGPTEHHTKRGTPTMGGLIILLAVLLGYFGSHLIFWRIPSWSGMLALFLFVGLGLVGFLDDWTKIRRARSLGLDAKAKLILQSIIGLVFAVLSLMFPDHRGVTPASSAVSFLRDIPGLALPAAIAVVWMMFIIASFSNGSNLTDGLDGLLSGVATMVFAAYVILNVWQSGQWCGRASTIGPRCYEVRNPSDLALFSIAVAGASFGFLWWNANPAKIFMGDTGSLALGGGVAALAIMSRTELLSAVLGAIFVLESLSVVTQVAFFKATKGKRLWRMAPMHHHFEALGWGEITVAVRMWILCGLTVALGVGLFYTEWVAAQ